MRSFSERAGHSLYCFGASLHGPERSVSANLAVNVQQTYACFGEDLMARFNSAIDHSWLGHLLFVLSVNPARLAWRATDSARVGLVHCKGGKERTLPWQSCGAGFSTRSRSSRSRSSRSCRLTRRDNELRLVTARPLENCEDSISVQETPSKM